MMNNIQNWMGRSSGSGLCGGLFRSGLGMPWGGWIMWIIGLLLVVVLVFVLVKTGILFKRKSDEPLESLKKRYANGEITKEEFLEKKEFLKSL